MKKGLLVEEVLGLKLTGFAGGSILGGTVWAAVR